MKVDVRFMDGSKEAVSEIGRLRDVALMEGAIAMEGECVVRCPVRTGRLRMSIGRRVRLGDGSVSGSEKEGGLEGSPSRPGEAFVGTNVSYAPHVEYGTRYQKAQPYMRPGAVAAEPVISEIFKRRMGQPVEIRRMEDKDAF